MSTSWNAQDIFSFFEKYSFLTSDQKNLVRQKQYTPQQMNQSLMKVLNELKIQEKAHRDQIILDWNQISLKQLTPTYVLHRQVPNTAQKDEASRIPSPTSLTSGVAKTRSSIVTAQEKHTNSFLKNESSVVVPKKNEDEVEEAIEDIYFYEIDEITKTDPSEEKEQINAIRRRLSSNSSSFLLSNQPTDPSSPNAGRNRPSSINALLQRTDDIIVPVRKASSFSSSSLVPPPNDLLETITELQQVIEVVNNEKFSLQQKNEELQTQCTEKTRLLNLATQEVKSLEAINHALSEENEKLTNNLIQIREKYDKLVRIAKRTTMMIQNHNSGNNQNNSQTLGANNTTSRRSIRRPKESPPDSSEVVMTKIEENQEEDEDHDDDEKEDSVGEKDNNLMMVTMGEDLASITNDEDEMMMMLPAFLAAEEENEDNLIEEEEKAKSRGHSQHYQASRSSHKPVLMLEALTQTEAVSSFPFNKTENDSPSREEASQTFLTGEVIAAIDATASSSNGFEEGGERSRQPLSNLEILRRASILQQPQASPHSTRRTSSALLGSSFSVRKSLTETSSTLPGSAPGSVEVSVQTDRIHNDFLRQSLLLATRASIPPPSSPTTTNKNSNNDGNPAKISARDSRHHSRTSFSSSSYSRNNQHLPLSLQMTSSFSSSQQETLIPFHVSAASLHYYDKESLQKQLILDREVISTLQSEKQLLVDFYERELTTLKSELADQKSATLSQLEKVEKKFQQEQQEQEELHQQQERSAQEKIEELMIQIEKLKKFSPTTIASSSSAIGDHHRAQSPAHSRGGTAAGRKHSMMPESSQSQAQTRSHSPRRAMIELSSASPASPRKSIAIRGNNNHQQRKVSVMSVSSNTSSGKESPGRGRGGLSAHRSPPVPPFKRQLSQQVQSSPLSEAIQATEDLALLPEEASSEKTIRLLSSNNERLQEKVHQLTEQTEQQEVVIQQLQQQIQQLLQEKQQLLLGRNSNNNAVANNGNSYNNSNSLILSEITTDYDFHHPPATAVNINHHFPSKATSGEEEEGAVVYLKYDGKYRSPSPTTSKSRSRGSAVEGAIGIATNNTTTTTNATAAANNNTILSRGLSQSQSMLSHTGIVTQEEEIYVDEEEEEEREGDFFDSIASEDPVIPQKIRPALSLNAIPLVASEENKVSDREEREEGEGEGGGEDAFFLTQERWIKKEAVYLANLHYLLELLQEMSTSYQNLAQQMNLPVQYHQYQQNNNNNGTQPLDAMMMMTMEHSLTSLSNYDFPEDPHWTNPFQDQQLQQQQQQQQQSQVKNKETLQRLLLSNHQYLQKHQFLMEQLQQLQQLTVSTAAVRRNKTPKEMYNLLKQHYFQVAQDSSKTTPTSPQKASSSVFQRLHQGTTQSKAQQQRVASPRRRMVNATIAPFITLVRPKSANNVMQTVSSPSPRSQYPAPPPPLTASAVDPPYSSARLNQLLSEEMIYEGAQSPYLAVPSNNAAQLFQQYYDQGPTSTVALPQQSQRQQQQQQQRPKSASHAVRSGRSASTKPSIVTSNDISATSSSSSPRGGGVSSHRANSPQSHQGRSPRNQYPHQTHRKIVGYDFPVRELIQAMGKQATQSTAISNHAYEKQ